MNEQIRKLAKQAGMKECSLGYGMPENVLWGERQVEVFAELIVEECASMVQDCVDRRVPASEYPEIIRQMVRGR